MPIHPPEKCWLNPHIHLSLSAIEGKGFFASADIKKGETVLIWGGKGYTDRTGAEKAKQAGKTIMQWDHDIFSYDAGEEDTPYAINHSCDPNCWMKDAFTLTARRSIFKGEEVTTDYALWEIDENYISQWICQCGAACCRGQITGNDWKNQVLQQRYFRHFSPLINSLIESRHTDINHIQTSAHKTVVKKETRLCSGSSSSSS